MEREIDEFLERIVTKYATNSSNHAQILEKVAEKARDFDDPAKSTRRAPKPACGDLSTTSTHFPTIFHTIEEREALTVRENAEVRSWFCVKSGASYMFYACVGISCLSMLLAIRFSCAACHGGCGSPWRFAAQARSCPFAWLLRRYAFGSL